MHEVSCTPHAAGALCYSILLLTTLAHPQGQGCGMHAGATCYDVGLQRHSTVSLSTHCSVKEPHQRLPLASVCCQQALAVQ